MENSSVLWKIFFNPLDQLCFLACVPLLCSVQKQSVMLSRSTDCVYVIISLLFVLLLWLSRLQYDVKCFCHLSVLSVFIGNIYKLALAALFWLGALYCSTAWLPVWLDLPCVWSSSIDKYICRIFSMEQSWEQLLGRCWNVLLGSTVLRHSIV